MCEIDIDIGDNLAIGMYAPRRGENEDEQPLYMYARYGDVCMVASSFKNIIMIYRLYLTSSNTVLASRY